MQHGIRTSVSSIVLLLALQAVSSASQPVSVANAGFESPVLTDGTPQAGVTNWTTFGTGDIGTLNPTTSDFPAEAAEGQNVAYVYGATGEAGISQTLSGTLGKLQADATYALTVKVGNTNIYSGFPGYRVQLLANGTVLSEDDNTQSPGEGTFVTSTVNYVYNAGLHSALVGQPLEIRLIGKGLDGTEVEFDDVQLTASLASPVAVSGGPYTVFIGGSLVLNGSASLPSDGATVTTYEWDLNNDGSYAEGITGANPAAISQADLVSIHGMALGGNTIKLRVTDSAAKTSTVETSVNILPATALVYEPFNYPGTALNGASGTTEVGLTGAWNASADSKLGPNRSYGPLVTRGAGIGDLQGGINRYGGARAVSASALAANGLLNDGATLWFSLIMGYDTGGNVTNSRLAFALASNQFSGSNFTYNILNETSPVAINGSGLGVSLGNFTGNGKVAATRFTNSGSGFSGNTFGTASPVLYGAGQNGLIVGKITWGTGGGNDTIEIYNPGLDLALPATPISTLSVAVDQSVFDTITWARGDKVVMDEIRFGASYQSVIETGSAWDLNGDVAGSGGPSPSGSWNTDANWNVAPDGTLVPIPWQPGGVATFAAGSDATGAYTVTVDGSRDIGGLIVEEGTVAISGGTALRMTKDTTMSVATGLTTTIATPLSEDAPGRQFAKAGPGTLVLSGNNAGATGAMNLAAGVTQFESPAAINGTARNMTIGSGGTIAFGSAFGAGNIPAALLNRVVATSTGTIAADNYASTDFDFNAAGLTSAFLGAAGNVNYTGTLTPNGGTYRLGGGGGTLTMANLNALSGSNSVVVNGNVALAQDNGYTGATTINPGASLTIAGATSTSGVTLNTPNANLILGNNNSLGTGTLNIANSFAGPSTLSAIGTVVTTNPVAANTDLNIGGTGALTLGTITLNNNVVIANNNTTATTTLGAVTSAGGTRTLTISGNGNTTVTGSIGGGTDITTITKNGTGILTLSGVNSPTGAITISGGTLKVANAGALGFGPPQTTTTPGTTVSSGFTLDLNGTNDINEPITLNGTGVGANGALVNNSGTPASIGSGIAGATVAATGTGSGYSTPPVVAISGSGSGATATASLGLTNASFTVNVAGDRVYTANPTVTITGGGGSGATATPVMSGGKVVGLNITAAGRGYTTAPTATVSGGTSTGTTTTTFTGNATNFCVGGLTMTATGSGYAGTTTFTFNGTPQTANATLSSVILAAASSIGGTGDITINGLVSGSQALTKVGSGTLILAGTNTYTGATNVSAGKLLVNGNSTAATGAVNVGASATLGGTGTIGGTTTVADTGVLEFNLSGPAVSHDKLELATGKTLAFSGASTLTITSSGGAATGTYTLLTAPGGITGSPPATVNVPAGWTYDPPTITGVGNTDLVINITSVGGSPYDTWAAGTFANPFTNTSPGVDFDNDGLSNLLEFVLGGDPTISQPGIAPGVSTSGGNLVITFKRSDASELAPAVTVKVELSSDLTFSTPSQDITIGPASDPGPIAPSGASYTVSNSGGFDTITVTIPQGADPKKFARVRAIKP